MQRFLGVFDVSKVPLMSDALTKESSVEEARERIDIESLYHPPSIEIPNWEAAKDRPVYAMTLAEQSVDKFLIRLGQLTGVPIGWDIEHSRFTAIQTGSKIGLSVERSSLGSLLEPELSKIGIVVGKDASGAALLRSKVDSLKEKLPQDWSIDDLCSEVASEPLWRDLMLRFFKASSLHWRLEGRKMIWLDGATSLEQATIAAFLDQIRRANGLKPKSSLPNEVCDPTLGLKELDLRLAKPIRESSSNPIR